MWRLGKGFQLQNTNGLLCHVLSEAGLNENWYFWYRKNMRAKPFVLWFLFLSLYHLFQAIIIYYLFLTLHDYFVIFCYKNGVFVLPCCIPTAGLLAGKLRHGDWQHLPALSLQMFSSNLSTATPCQKLFFRSGEEWKRRICEAQCFHAGELQQQNWRDQGMGAGTVLLGMCRVLQGERRSKGGS